MMMMALMKTSPMDQSQNRPGAILRGSGREAAGRAEPAEPAEPDLVVCAADTLPS
jgi:hypothetical protein